MAALTSPQGHGLNFTTFALAVGNGASPEVFTPIANCMDFTLPVTTVMVETTNSADNWVSRQPVIGDMGKITSKIFWEPADTSMYNGANGGSVAPGVRYLLINRVKTDFQAQYPNGSVDNFPGYVTNFGVTGKVKDVFQASLEISNSGSPSLC